MILQNGPSGTQDKKGWEPLLYVTKDVLVPISDSKTILFMINEWTWILSAFLIVKHLSFTMHDPCSLKHPSVSVQSCISWYLSPSKKLQKCPHFCTSFLASKIQLLVLLQLNSVKNKTKLATKCQLFAGSKMEKMKCRQKAMDFIGKVNFLDIAIGLSQCAKGPERNR